MSKVKKSVSNSVSPAEMSVLGNIRGAEYVYPERMEQMKSIRKTLFSTAEQWGYNQIEGPTLQPVEFYRVKSSTELLKEGYYVSTGGKDYMLRPEITPTIAYMLSQVERSVSFPVRWYSDPEIYRNERPQSGRRRQFGQFNLDRFDLGTITPEERALADAEVISSSLDILKRLGLKSDDVVMKINSRSLLENAFDKIGVNGIKIRISVLGIIDAKTKMSEEDFLTKLSAVGLNDEQIKGLMHWLGLDSLEAIKNDENMRAMVDSPEFKELLSVFEWIKQYGYEDFITYDPTIVRGLGYYTGTVFEAYDRYPEKSMGRSILGGGRYDRFTEKFGGKVNITGVGFGAGQVPLETVLKSRNLLPEAGTELGPDYYVASMHSSKEGTTSRINDIMAIAKAVREGKSSIVFDPSVARIDSLKLTRQLSSADKLEATTVLIFFDNSKDEGKVVVKQLATGEQEEVGVEEFIASLK